MLGAGADESDGLGNRLWRALSPGSAHALRALLRARWVPTGVKAHFWRQAEMRVSHYGVRGHARTLSGHVLEVNTSKMVEKQIFYFGEWEPYFSRYLSDHGPWQGNFVDIGANIGYFSLLASNLFDRVIAIEASPSIFQRLKHNVDANQASSRIRLHNVAVGERAGELDFYFDPGQSGGSSLLPGGGRAFEAKVPVRKLSELLSVEDLARATFIKIDVEGLESVVLDQILELRDYLHPDLRLMVEYGPERGMDESLSRFREAGFAMRLLQGPYQIGEYLDPAVRSTLTVINEVPEFFSDILLERRS